MTKSITNCLAEALSDQHIGLTTTIVLCDAIVADARFNIWFADVMKKKSKEEIDVTLDEHERLTLQSNEIVEGFRMDHNLPKLESSLKALAARLNEFRERSF